MVIFMTSVDLCDSEVIQKGIERAIQRYKKGEMLAKVLSLKSFEWAEHPLFKKSEVTAINSEPIELAQNRAEAWRQVSHLVHRDIETWVKVLSKKIVG